MADKKIKAPFVPKITGPTDTSNFAEEFTKMIPTDSPAGNNIYIYTYMLNILISEAQSIPD